MLYRKISDGIRNDIDNGVLTVGSRLPGVRDLAIEWNTSANTVLKALDELESEGYLRKKRGQGIFVEPQNFRQAVKSEGQKTLELVLYDMNVPFNRLFVASAEKTAASYGFSLSVKTMSTGYEISKSPNVRIIVPSTITSNELVERNTVYVGEFSPPADFKGNYAVVDAYGGFYRAAELLQRSGRERIAYIGASDTLEDEAGWNACRDLLSGTRHGFKREYAVSAGGWDADAGRAAMDEILLAGEFPDGIICSNDTLAAGALKACHAAGLVVPDDISIIGAGDQDIAPLLEPSLTSLRIPVETLALIAVSYLNRLQNEKTEPLRARFDMELIIRESASEKSALDSGSFVDDSIWL